MKEVTVLIPDDVDAERIYYLPNNRTEYVRALIVPDRVGGSKDEEVYALNKKMSAEEIEQFNEALKSAPILPIPQEYPVPPYPSREEFEALCTRVQRLELLTTSFQPSAEEGLRIVGYSDKEIEEIRSRVEKLERESERQCARVIKMEEGISDDLK